VRVHAAGDVGGVGYEEGVDEECETGGDEGLRWGGEVGG